MYHHVHMSALASKTPGGNAAAYDIRLPSNSIWRSIDAAAGIRNRVTSDWEALFLPASIAWVRGVFGAEASSCGVEG